MKNYDQRQGFVRILVNIPQAVDWSKIYILKLHKLSDIDSKQLNSTLTPPVCVPLLVFPLNL